MAPYYILCVVPVLLCMLENRGLIIKKGNKSKRIYGAGVTAFFVIFIALLSLRSMECGSDVKNYFIYFNRYSGMSFRELFRMNGVYDVEVGYRFLNNFFHLFSDNFQIYLAIVAVISVVPVLILYKRESRHSIFVISLFLWIAPFSLYFSGLRQIIAMAFGVFAYYFTKNRKPIPFILCILLATTFHSSAFILLLLYPIYHAKITKNWLYVVVPIMALIFVFNRAIFNRLLSFLSNTQFDRFTMSSTGAYGMIVLLVVFTAYILLITNGREIILSEDEMGLRNILLLSTCLQFFAPLNPVAMRMNYYYLIFVPIAMDRLSIKRDARFAQLVKVGTITLTVFFFAVFVRNMYVGADILNIYPYVPFWK